MQSSTHGREVSDTPRSNFDRQKTARGRLATSIILTLDKEQITKIKRDFKWGLHEDRARRPKQSVKLSEFVSIMMANVDLDNFRGAAKEDVISSLIELFDQMDLDGSGSLDFEEFLATIINLGLSGADQLVLNPIKHYVEGPTLRTQKNPTEQILRQTT
ncbi:hypothetical protein AAMO2058_001644500 [Amorphochlora amoebiformis]